MGIIKKLLKKIVLNRKLEKLQSYADIKSKLVISRYTSIVNTGNKTNVQIGEHCTIFGNLFALCGGTIIIGKNNFIGTDTCIESKENIVIGDNVIISSNVTICDNNNHPTNPKERQKMSLCDDYINDELWSWNHAESKPVEICDNTWIGKNAVILKGVCVGQGAIVAAEAVVTKDVPPYTVAAGNPAKVVKELDRE